MDKLPIYTFLAGLHIGGQTNFIIRIGLTLGIILYIKPDFYSQENILYMKETGIKVLQMLQM